MEIKLSIKIIFYFFEADQTLFFSKCKQEYPEMLGLFKILGTQFCLFCKKFSQNLICIECFACWISNVKYKVSVKYVIKQTLEKLIV